MAEKVKNESKIESIIIMKAEDLPAIVRKEENLDKGFVEIRVTRQSPPVTEITQLHESPLKTMRAAFKREGALGFLDFMFRRWD